MSEASHSEPDIQQTKPQYLPEDEAVEETLIRMKAAERHTIWFLSEEDAAYCRQNEEGAAFMVASDLILSGTDPEDQEAGSETKTESSSSDVEKYTINYLRGLLSYLNETRRTIYLVMKSGNACSVIINYLEKHAPDLDHHIAIITEGSQAEADSIVNDINAVLPDLVLFGLPIDAQISFMQEYYPMMNTRICICMSSLEHVVGGGEVPEIIKKLHLTGIYQWIQKGKNTR